MTSSKNDPSQSLSHQCVLDASALLALLHHEPGGESVRPHLPDAVISSVNWAEVVQKCVARNVRVEGLRSDLESLGMQVLPFNADDAEVSGRLWSDTKALGLSLGDRACLALGQRLHLPVLTADRVWGSLPVDFPVQIIR
ncbi:type II toxin-antitoxin system VapC family toxin [Acidithiobacillus thiooxidans]|uniref:type II toxin-antitoxin system VapC family toxin n=1 Tax=Acidithiobacillus thiooxidans TaxID=930 RepID=UPI0002624DAB|nr:type II toxin-antitoxin system VapC family toxin [Acidithiobacillus thiooxidans]MBU2810273.1 type II toxin-antitoxin system VapC family toxin [Acidithiobacillus thiooxidans]